MRDFSCPDTVDPSLILKTSLTAEAVEKKIKNTAKY